MDEQLPFLYVQLAPFERWLDCREIGTHRSGRVRNWFQKRLRMYG